MLTQRIPASLQPYSNNHRDEVIFNLPNDLLLIQQCDSNDEWDRLVITDAEKKYRLALVLENVYPDNIVIFPEAGKIALNYTVGIEGEDELDVNQAYFAVWDIKKLLLGNSQPDYSYKLEHPYDKRLKLTSLSSFQLLIEYGRHCEIRAHILNIKTYQLNHFIFPFSQSSCFVNSDDETRIICGYFGRVDRILPPKLDAHHYYIPEQIIFTPTDLNIQICEMLGNQLSTFTLPQTNAKNSIASFEMIALPNNLLAVSVELERRNRVRELWNNWLKPNQIGIWDLQTKQRVTTLEAADTIQKLAKSLDGTLVSVTRSGVVQYWNAYSPNCLCTVTTGLNNANDISVDKDFNITLTNQTRSIVIAPPETLIKRYQAILDIAAKQLLGTQNFPAQEILRDYLGFFKVQKESFVTNTATAPAPRIKR